jgi:hypothetical protein
MSILRQLREIDIKADGVSDSAHPASAGFVLSTVRKFGTVIECQVCVLIQIKNIYNKNLKNENK